jgi:hypothetical protein
LVLPDGQDWCRRPLRVRGRRRLRSEPYQETMTEALLSLADGQPIQLGQQQLAAQLLAVLQHLATDVGRIADGIERLAEVHAPVPKEKVGTAYIAERLGKTTTWIAQMARESKIPRACIVAGTGLNGTRWSFYREPVDRWLDSR